ncbi:hypothetical protein [Mycobacterium sp. GA-2829]|nr:hypothetical protein [Mycobacterium sp. GA-2829]
MTRPLATAVLRSVAIAVDGLLNAVFPLADDAQFGTTAVEV